MKLRGIDFGSVHLASGTGGFKCDGSEYWYHKSGPHFLRPNFINATRTTKTATLNARTRQNGANMDLDKNLRPKEFFPRSIAINPFLCCSVNAIGLANPGLQTLLNLGIWQSWEKPFFLSLMAVADTVKERLSEWEQMIKILLEYKKEFVAPFAIQINLSCPNIGHNPDLFINESEQIFNICKKLQMPQVPKFNALQISAEIGARIGNHNECDALLISNTLPWKELPLWVRIVSFGTPFSPLLWRGIKQDGGYSGPFLRENVKKRIRELREYGFKKSIIACGNIVKLTHVNQMRNVGANAIEFATVAMTRPWRVQGIIQHANKIFEGGEK